MLGRARLSASKRAYLDVGTYQAASEYDSMEESFLMIHITSGDCSEKRGNKRGRVESVYEDRRLPANGSFQPRATKTYLALGHFCHSIALNRTTHCYSFETVTIS